MEWQLIETAPKNGTWILAASDEEGVCIAQWVAGDWYQDNRDEPTDDFTHWMPLPEYPK